MGATDAEKSSGGGRIFDSRLGSGSIGTLLFILDAV